MSVRSGAEPVLSLISFTSPPVPGASSDSRARELAEELFVQPEQLSVLPLRLRFGLLLCHGWLAGVDGRLVITSLCPGAAMGACWASNGADRAVNPRPEGGRTRWGGTSRRGARSSDVDRPGWSARRPGANRRGDQRIRSRRGVVGTRSGARRAGGGGGRSSTPTGVSCRGRRSSRPAIVGARPCPVGPHAGGPGIGAFPGDRGRTPGRQATLLRRCRRRSPYLTTGPIL